LILVGIVTTVAYVQTRVALREASKANDERGQALASEKVERERAESLLTTSLAALDSVFNRLVPDQLEQGRALAMSGQDQSGQTAAVSPESAALLEDLLKVYDQLAAGQGTQARLGLESARANRRIGDIHMRLGNLDHASAAYQQSIEKYQAIASSNSDPKIQLEIARLHNDLGAIYDRQRNVEKSRGEYQLALALLESSSSNATSSNAAPADVRFEAARTHFLLGRGSNPQSEPEPPPDRGPRPERGRRRPVDHRGGPPDDFGGGPPDEPNGRGDGPLPGHGHRPPQDFKHHGPPPDDDRGGPPPEERGEGPDRPPKRPHPKRVDRKELSLAMSLLDSLIKSDPKNPSYRYLLAQCCREEADPHSTASTEIKQAEQLLTQLVKEHPEVADYHFALADTYAMSDIRELAPEDFSQAEKNLRAALSESTTLVDRNPYATDYAALHVHILHKLAGILRLGPPERAGAPATVDEVGRLYQDAIRKQASLVQRFPGNLAYRFWLGKFRMSLGEFWLERRNPEEAKKVFEAAIRDVEPSYTGQLSTGALGDVLHQLYDRLAESLGAVGDPKAAQSAQEKAGKIGPRRPRPPHPGPPDDEGFPPRGRRPEPPPREDDGPEFGPEWRPPRR
jgi:tetratricopeptide (TPR) repeat protein